MEYQTILESLSHPKEWPSSKAYRKQCRACLKTLDRKIEPVLWACFQVKLGCSYLLESEPGKSEIQKSVRAFQQALEEAQLPPEDRAAALLNLSLLIQESDHDEEILRYRIRIREDFLSLGQTQKTTEHLATRVGLCLDRYSLASISDEGDWNRILKEALAIRNDADPEHYPTFWGTVQLIIAQTLVAFDEEEEALEEFRVAFCRLPRESLPLHWESGKLEMAHILMRVPRRTEQVLNEVIEVCRDGLSFNDEGPKEIVAELNQTLADALLERHNLFGGDELSLAIEVCRRALFLWDIKTEPDDVATCLVTLGQLLAITGEGYTYREKKKIKRLANFLERHHHLLDEELLGTCLCELAKIYLSSATNRAQIIKGIGYAESALELEGYLEARDRRDTLLVLGNLAHEGAVRFDQDTMNQALDAFNEALKLTDPDLESTEYGQILINLGAAFTNHPGREVNYEEGIKRLRQAQEFYTPESDQRSWLQLQENLANALMNHIEGDRFDNLDEAYILLTVTLGQTSSSRLPHQWARLKMLLATICDTQEMGDIVAKRDEAIQHYQEALEILTVDDHPKDWVEATLQLASCYLYRRNGNQADNLAETWHLLGKIEHSQIKMGTTSLAFYYLLRGSLFEDYKYFGTADEAILGYRKMIKVLNRGPKGAVWAMFHHILGAAYDRKLRQGNKKLFRPAVHHLKKSLSYFSPETDPYMYRSTNIRLGKLFDQRSRWRDAAACYERAIEINEWLYEAVLFLPHGEMELSAHPDLYGRAAFVSAQRGDGYHAVNLLERNRARSFRQRIQFNQHLSQKLEETHPELVSNYRKAARKLLQSIRKDWLFAESRDWRLQGQMRHGERSDILAARHSFEKIRQQIEPLLDVDPLMDQPNPRELLELTSGRALVYILTVEIGSVALWVRQEEVTIISIKDYSLDQLVQRLEEDESAPENLFGYGQIGVEPLSVEVMDAALADVGTRLMAPILKALSQKGVRQAIFIPCGILGIFPLHAASLPNEMGYVLEHLEITFAPSAFALKIARDRQQRVSQKKQTLLAIANPMPHSVPLPFSLGEVAAAAHTFSDALCFTDTDATVINLESHLKSATHLLLACHGVFDVSDLLNSGLELARGEQISLRELFMEMKYEEKRWVFLSACQSGLFRFEHLPDEVTGLPLAFLKNGAAGVIAALWPLDDFSTSILAMRFFEELSLAKGHQEAPFQPGSALVRAQRWLQAQTTENLQRWLNLRPYADALPPQFRERVERRLNDYQADSRPFSHPKDWGALIYVGV